MRAIKITYLMFVCIAAIMAGCNTYKYVPVNGVVDSRFVGIWKGEDKSEERGNISWVQKRRKNGTYRIDFRIEKNGIVTTKTEKGYWWIVDDRFCEVNPDIMMAPDIYEYEILDEKRVKFTIIKAGHQVNIPSSGYTFIDVKIRD